MHDLIVGENGCSILRICEISTLNRSSDDDPGIQLTKLEDLAIFLQISPDDRFRIRSKDSSSFEKLHDILSRWKSKFSSKATLQELVDTLTKLDLNHVADKLKSAFLQEVPRATHQFYNQPPCITKEKLADKISPLVFVDNEKPYQPATQAQNNLQAAQGPNYPQSAQTNILKPLKAPKPSNVQYPGLIYPHSAQRQQFPHASQALNYAQAAQGPNYPQAAQIPNYPQAAQGQHRPHSPQAAQGQRLPYASQTNMHQGPKVSIIQHQGPHIGHDQGNNPYPNQERHKSQSNKQERYPELPRPRQSNPHGPDPMPQRNQGVPGQQFNQRQQNPLDTQNQHTGQLTRPPLPPDSINYGNQLSGQGSLPLGSMAPSFAGEPNQFALPIINQGGQIHQMPNNFMSAPHDPFRIPRDQDQHDHAGEYHFQRRTRLAYKHVSDEENSDSCDEEVEEPPKETKKKAKSNYSATNQPPSDDEDEFELPPPPDDMFTKNPNPQISTDLGTTFGTKPQLNYLKPTKISPNYFKLNEFEQFQQHPRITGQNIPKTVTFSMGPMSNALPNYTATNQPPSDDEEDFELPPPPDDMI